MFKVVTEGKYVSILLASSPVNLFSAGTLLHVAAIFSTLLKTYWKFLHLGRWRRLIFLGDEICKIIYLGEIYFYDIVTQVD